MPSLVEEMESESESESDMPGLASSDSESESEPDSGMPSLVSSDSESESEVEYESFLFRDTRRRRTFTPQSFPIQEHVVTSQIGMSGIKCLTGVTVSNGTSTMLTAVDTFSDRNLASPDLLCSLLGYRSLPATFESRRVTLRDLHCF